jgi:hypothetical protein
MKITPKLKQWLVENVKLAADAADEAVKAAVAEAMVAGKLTSEKYAELAADEDADEADDLAKKLDEALSLMKKSAEEKPAGKKTTDAKMAGVDMGKVLNDEGDEGDKAAGEKNIRVKGAWERYSATKSAPRYPAGHTFAGQEVHEGDGTFPIGPGRRAVQGVSQRDKACIGAYIKAARQPADERPRQRTSDLRPEGNGVGRCHRQRLHRQRQKGCRPGRDEADGLAAEGTH